MFESDSCAVMFVLSRLLINPFHKFACDSSLWWHTSAYGHSGSSRGESSGNCSRLHLTSGFRAAFLFSLDTY